jgi:hypothetical protein
MKETFIKIKIRVYNLVECGEKIKSEKKQKGRTETDLLFNVHEMELRNRESDVI